MLGKLFAWLFGGRGKARASASQKEASRHAATAPAGLVPADEPAVADDQGVALLCREPILGRDRKVVGYHFKLREGSRRKARSASRVTGHLLAELLVMNLVRSDIGHLLGHRLAFIDLPDSFLEHPALSALPPKNMVVMPTRTVREGAPTLEQLQAALAGLRRKGFRVAIPDPATDAYFRPLLPIADVVVLHAPALDVASGLKTSGLVVASAPQARLLVRGVPSLEDFRFCFKLGAHFFQGPFITRREDWSERNLGPNTLRIAQLIGRLRAGAEIQELAQLLKQDAALSVRMLRYINAAANGLQEQVSSIERALMLLGRDPLYRWLALLVCSSDDESGQNSAALENALVRARSMEILASGRPQPEQDALFLTGLLSLIDVVLQVPLERALGPLVLAPEIEEAIRDNDGPFASRLALAIACEAADPDAIESAAGQCGVAPREATAAHFEALSWVLEIQGRNG
ncbi:MAG TPA: HDOD domain-containing protein [Rhodocyclaceae bacterium]|nr:HDOD domain-containing protein [Rhodocyclaceae bacterium]